MGDSRIHVFPTEAGGGFAVVGGSMDWMAMQREWELATSTWELPAEPTLLSPARRETRSVLVREEVSELLDEIDLGHDLEALAKELADVMYVVLGTAVQAGIPIEAVFAEVHRSNMTKVGPDGSVVRRKDGKILKGPNYEPANIARAFGWAS